MMDILIVVTIILMPFAIYIFMATDNELQKQLTDEKIYDIIKKKQER